MGYSVQTNGVSMSRLPGPLCIFQINKLKSTGPFTPAIRQAHNLSGNKLFKKNATTHRIWSERPFSQCCDLCGHSINNHGRISQSITSPAVSSFTFLVDTLTSTLLNLFFHSRRFDLADTLTCAAKALTRMLCFSTGACRVCQASVKYY